MIVVTEIKKTCFACPAQWEGKTDDEQVIYIRYRWGSLTVQVLPSLDKMFEHEPVFSWQSPTGDGFMEYSELKELTRDVISLPETDGSEETDSVERGASLPARNQKVEEMQDMQSSVSTGLVEEDKRGTNDEELRTDDDRRDSEAARGIYERCKAGSSNGHEEAEGRSGDQTSRFDGSPREGAEQTRGIDQCANWTVDFWFSGRGRPEKESVSIMGLGLAGEAGEVVEHLKKFVRDDHINVPELKKELGDSIYYWCRICKQFGLEPTDVIQANVEKLVSRHERGVLRGDGDNR